MRVGRIGEMKLFKYFKKATFLSNPEAPSIVSMSNQYDFIDLWIMQAQILACIGATCQKTSLYTNVKSTHHKIYIMFFLVYDHLCNQNMWKMSHDVIVCGWPGHGMYLNNSCKFVCLVCLHESLNKVPHGATHMHTL